MSTYLNSKITRLFLAMIVLMGLFLAQPAVVSAAYPSFDIVAVKSDESVTIHTNSFPANVNFTVRMDVAGNLAIDGIAVTDINSGQGGTFEATFKIPAELKGTKTIAIRLESTRGYYAYDWFNNVTQGTTPSNPVPVTSGKPYLTFLGVKANQSVTIEAHNLAVNTTFTVRVGPYYTFFRDYVTVPSVRSDSNGYVKFTITLPDNVLDENLVTVRLDGGGRYTFNAFKNVDSGTVTTIPVTSTSTCQIVSVTPSSAMPTRADFDTVWTIKNTSSKTWDGNSVDYKFVSGTKLQKYGSYYDLHQTVKPGETIKVTLDMVAPSTTGYYTTNWALVQNNTTLCNLTMTLRVK